MTARVTIRKPDDWHLHVRDGAMLKASLPFTARNFGRAILMPNLLPPVTTTKDAAAYRERVMAMIKQKAKGEEIVTEPSVSEKPHRVINLMAALEASLAEAKKQKRRLAHAGNGHDGRRRKSA